MSKIVEHQQALEALRQSEQRFSQLAANVPGIIYQFLRRTDGSMSFPYISSGCHKLFELDPGLLQENALPLVELIHPDDRESFELSVAASVASLQPWGWEGRFVTPSGKLVWLSGASRPEQFSNGDILWDGLLIDITERKQVQEALQKSEERFRTSVETMLDCFGIYTSIRDESGKILDFRTEYLNAAACESDRVTKEEVIGKGLCELLPSHRESGLFEEYSQVVETGNPLIKEDLIYEDNYGEVRLTRAYDIRIAKLGDGFVAAWRDITDHKQALFALQESEERFRQLAENINQVFWLRSADYHTLIYVSPAYEEVWARSCESLYRKPDSWLEAVHPQDRDRLFSASTKPPEASYEEEYRIVEPNGSVRWIRDHIFPIVDEHGTIYRIAGIAEDITAQKQRSVEISNSLQKERELGELKSSFIAMTSHEFRTPLATIQSSAELLERYQQKLSPDKQLIHLQRIQAAVERMTQMLNDILIISEVDVGKLSFNPQATNLVQFCQELVEDLQLSVKETQTLIFTHHLGGSENTLASENRGSEDNSYQLDAKLLRQILSNLLSNALKYSPAGTTVQFNLSYLNGKAVFRIQDQGIGIPPEDLSHLFESFHRATNVGSIQGTGLGLAIVKQCVDLHRGEITVESEVNKGSTFTVTLPLDN